MKSPNFCRTLLLAAVTLLAVPVHAAVNATLGVEGAIMASGGPAADGVYDLSFSLLDAPTGKALWSEGPFPVAVKTGQFATQLGIKTPVDPALLDGERWIQVKVGADPALPATPLRSVASALRSALAEGVACTGCIKAGHIDPAVFAPLAKVSDLAGLAKATDLGDYVKASALAKIAASGDYADLKNTPKLADVAATGQYGDLLGLPVLAKVGAACGTGLMMHGIKADGSYDCAIGFDASMLPKDGLNEISNELLTNQFTEVAASLKTPIDIADALAAGTSDSLTVPDYGVAQGLTVSIDLTNSDISKVRVTLYDPNGAEYKLYDQSGPGTALKTTYPAPTKTVTGDLTTWVGKNPKGIWSISVADFAGTIGKTDGKINSWSINVATLSSKKVAANGVLLANGGLKWQVATSHPVVCAPDQLGYTYLNSKDKALYVCNGKEFYPISLAVAGTADNPGVSCKDILTKVATAKSGFFYIDPDGVGAGKDAFQVWCDMTTDGGGWTRGMVFINGDKSSCDTSKRWDPILTITKGWPGGGNVMSKWYPGVNVAHDGGTPASVVKFNSGPYGSVYTMFTFPPGAESWQYSGSGAFNLQVITGTGYGNAIWWNWGGAVDHKANYCIGTSPDHHSCVYEGTYHGQCGSLYHNGTWSAGPSAQELYVRE